MSPVRRGNTVRINLTLTDEELAVIDEAAKSLGYDRSNFMRGVALKAAKEALRRDKTR